MKSIKAQELLDWLYDEEEIKKYTLEDVVELIEISEIELSGDRTLLSNKIRKFRNKKRKNNLINSILSLL